LGALTSYRDVLDPHPLAFSIFLKNQILHDSEFPGFREISVLRYSARLRAGRAASAARLSAAWIEQS
jgi:hypothetical protein